MSKKEDLVSIITPSYNSSKFIEETVRSVQNQTYSNWELLITDDCSTDNTFSILEKLADKDERIKIFKLAKNSGPAVARNNSIEKAKGKYLAFLDSDDLWFNFHLKNSINSIKVKKVGFVFASYKRSNQALEYVYSDFIVPGKVNYTDILKSNSISCLTAFIDISELGKKYMPLIKKRQDMGLWLSYLKEIPYAIGIEECHAVYRIRENSLSRDKKKLIKYQWEFYRKIEKLNIFKSLYFLTCWMYLGYKKYSN